MIICASRRTDICAFHSEWFMNRLREGYAMVRNPMAKALVHRVDLTRKNVDCIIFVTKDPRPMESHLREIASMGHMYTFHVTITPYGRAMEPNVRDKGDIIDCFNRISERIGADRMFWRYDPVILNSMYDIGYHKRKFEMLCRELQGHTETCIFSFVRMYNKLNPMESNGVIRSINKLEKEFIVRDFVPIAKRYGMNLRYCCSDMDMTHLGLDPRGCIDRSDLMRLNIPFDDMPSTIRENCRCVKSVDIGAYDSCLHDCVYCYANRADPSKRAERVYDPRSEMLWGSVGPDDVVTDLDMRSASRIEDFFR